MKRTDKSAVFVEGFKKAMAVVFEEWGNSYALPHRRTKPSPDTSPAEAFRQGYNIAIAVVITESGGVDRERRWKGWCSARWRGLT